jgi:hypothetical protein
MLFLACAWMFAQRIVINMNKSSNGRLTTLLWLGFISFSLAGVLSKNTVAIAIPVMLLEILIRYRAINRPKVIHLDWKKLIIVSVCIGVMGLTWFFVVPRIPLLARFNPAYYGSLLKFFFSSPHPNLLQALTGPFVSTGKSIFLFSPILLIPLWSLIRHFRSAWSAWLYLVLLIIFQALFYDDEWAGHINWGLRFVLPAIPPLVLSTSGTIEDWLARRKGLIALSFIAVVSIIIQLLGVLSPVSQFFYEKSSANPQVTEYATIWQAKQSILLWSAEWIAGGKPLDLAVTRNSGGLWLVLTVIILIASFAVVCVRNQKSHWGSILSLGIAISLNVSMLFLYRHDPVYSIDRMDLKLAQETLIEQSHPQDLILVKSYGTPVWKYLMNWGDEKILWTSLPYFFPTPDTLEKFNQTHNPEDALDSTTLALLNNETHPGQKVWILIPGDSSGADLDLEILWLLKRGEDLNCEKYTYSEFTSRLCSIRVTK